MNKALNSHLVQLIIHSFVEDMLQIVKEEGNSLQTMKRRKANWIGHMMQRNCLIKQIIEEKIQVMGSRGRRHKQLLDDLKEKSRYFKLREEAQNCTL
jgi:hypothetical protein